jgi:hypothetical protein
MLLGEAAGSLECFTSGGLHPAPLKYNSAKHVMYKINPEDKKAEISYTG